MKKIAIVTFNCALSGEKGLDRLYFLANLYAKNGYQVELITSRFHHWTKSFRDRKANFNSDNLKVVLCDEIGYEKNIQIKRIISHWVLARNILKYMSGRKYDVIYCHIPDNHLACLVSEFSKENGIPLIIDIEDLWPEAMRMIFNWPILSDILYFYFDKDAKQAFKNASAIVGSSNEYRDHPKKYGVNVDNSLTVYVGNDLKKFDISVEKYKSSIAKKKNEFWVSYAGTLGASYDIETLIKAAQIIKARGINEIKINILGDGPNREKLQKIALAKECNVRFFGYQPYEKMAAYLYKSDININSLVKTAPHGFVSKIGDYLASGHAVINTGSNVEFKNAVVREGWGINVEAQNPEKLANAIILLKNKPDVLNLMGKKGREIAMKKYNRETSYLGIIELTDKLLK